ncbi:hypothetical protein BH24PSE2_BH24PSE2_04020 [soil metagenome]
MTASPTPDPDRTATSTAGPRILVNDALVADRYRIVELIGVGGMGMVYRARDERLNVEVALKVLRPERIRDEQVMERFRQELILARQVSHRNVVRIHDIGQDGDLHFLTMDYVPGRSLKQMLETEGPFEPSRAAALARDIAEALAAAHRENVIHRDLKPGNVLVGDNGRAYVTDFGVARSLGSSGMTLHGHIVGTPDYLSPEQARGADVDGRTDIYALGLVLFEMLSGRLPFSGDSLEEVLAQRTIGEPRRLQDLGVQVPPPLRAIIERCLQRDPDDRYADAALLAEDLEKGSARRRLFAPRRRAQLASAGLAGIAGLAFASFAIFRDVGDDTPALQIETPTVAVLPLAVDTANAELAWISTGLAEMLTQHLGESAGLQVVKSLRVLRTLRDLKIEPGELGDRELGEIADLLDANRLVVGRAREAGGRLRIDADLVLTDLPGLPRRQVSVEGAAAANLFALADSIGAKLEAALEIPAPERPAARALSSSPAAMQAYAEGLEALTRGEPDAAEAKLEEAVKADSEFPAAWLRLADAREQRGYHDQALDAARRAVDTAGEDSGRIVFEARAREAALSGEFEHARDILAELVERYPSDIEARIMLAETTGDHGQLEEATAVLEEIVETHPDHPRPWYLLGKFAILSGHSRAAVDDYLVRALVIQNKLDNVRGQADVHNALGIAYDQLGRIDDAGREYELAVQLRRKGGDERGVAASLANLATIQRLQGNDEAARARLDEALATLQRIGDKRASANLHNEIGYFEEQKGAWRNALESYREALRIRRELNDQRAVAESYNNVGFAYYMLGEYDNAAVYAERAEALFESIGNREGLMSARQTLGLLETARGNWDKALKASLSALETSRELRLETAEAVSLGNIGRVAQLQGRYQAAEASYTEALALLEDTGDRRGLTEFTLFKAALALELGQLDAAAGHLDQAVTWLDEDANREQHATLMRLRAGLDLTAGNLAAARDTLQDAIEIAIESGSITARLEALLSLGEAELALGHAEQARERLATVYDEARGMRHAILELRAAEALARADWILGQQQGAEERVRDALQIARGHRPYAGAWRLHFLLGEFLRSTGRADEADVQWRKGAEEVARLKANLDGDAEASFSGLDEIRQLAQEIELDPAA